MICFNVPPYVGTEMNYIEEAIKNHKICGDGAFTKKCNQWLEEKTGVPSETACPFNNFMYPCDGNGGDSFGY